MNSPRIELWQAAVRTSAAGMLVNLATTLGVFMILRAYATPWLWAWLTAILVLSALRYSFYRLCRRQLRLQPGVLPPRTWVAAHHGGLLCSVLLWTLLAWWGIPYFPGPQQFAILIVMSALAAGATSTLAPLRITGKLYVLLLLLPDCWQLFALGGQANVTLALLGVVFSGVMLSNHQHNHRLLLHSIELAREKEGLITELSQQTQQVLRANAELEERVAERTHELHHMAHHDVLTGLPNRRWLLGSDERALHLEGHVFTAAFIDLDRFKQINDALGHDWGDLLLQEVAQRLLLSVQQLAHSLRARQHWVCRWGGDEFIVCLLCEAGAEEALEEGLRSVQQQLSQPYVFKERSLHPGASMGFCIQAADATLDLKNVIHGADLAASESKRLGRGRLTRYSEVLAALQTRRLALSVALNTAHLDGSLHLAFQPIVSAQDGHAVQSFEALLRWQCPGFGAVSPVEFIALAEESERILVLGRWVLQQACEQAVRWSAEAGPAPKVAVNTSIHQLVDPAFSELVLATLQQTGLAAERLVIEVTESVFDESNSQQALSSLLALHHLGVEIHIDDFGTGYSSLSRLREFPLNAIKIDKSFVLHQDERSMAVIEGAVLIAHRFGLRVIAEGIETAEHATRLADLGVDEFQGYHFGRPAPQAAEDWVAQRAAAASGASAAQV